MTLFFTYEEVRNIPTDLFRDKPFRVWSKTPDGRRALHPIYQIERKQPETILRRGDYYLPPRSQHIQWDFLPTEMAWLLKLGRKVSGFRHCTEDLLMNNAYAFSIKVDGSDWRKFFDEVGLRAWAKAYAVGLPEVIDRGEFELSLPENEEKMLPLEIVSRCKGARGTGEHTYRCHRRAWHGGWCQFIAPHRGVSCP